MIFVKDDMIVIHAMIEKSSERSLVFNVFGALPMSVHEDDIIYQYCINISPKKLFQTFNLKIGINHLDTV